MNDMTPLDYIYFNYANFSEHEERTVGQLLRRYGTKKRNGKYYPIYNEVYTIMDSQMERAYVYFLPMTIKKERRPLVTISYEQEYPVAINIMYMPAMDMLSININFKGMRDNLEDPIGWRCLNFSVELDDDLNMTLISGEAFRKDFYKKYYDDASIFFMEMDSFVFTGQSYDWRFKIYQDYRVTFCKNYMRLLPDFIKKCKEGNGKKFRIDMRPYLWGD